MLEHHVVFVSQLDQFMVELQEYKKKRKDSKKLVLFDLFRRNIHDPHSAANRLNSASSIIQQLNDCRNDQATSELIVKTFESICRKIELIDDETSELRQCLIKNRDRFILSAKHLSVDDASLHKIEMLQQQHFNKLLSQDLVRYEKQRVKDPLVSPGVYFSRIRDFFYPKRRDERCKDSLELAEQIKNCETKQDYENFVTKLAEKEGKLKGTNSNLVSIIKKVKGQINTSVLSNNPIITVTSDLNTAGSKAKALPQDNIDYFKTNFTELFTYRVIGQGVTRAGKVKREEGLLGAIGLKISVINPQLPGTSIVTAMIGGAMHAYDAQNAAISDKKVTQEVPHYIIDLVAPLLAEKMAYRYAHQVNALYHSPLYQKSLDSFINAALDNMLNNLQNDKKITLTDQQNKLYGDLLAIRQQEGRLTAEHQHQLDSLQAEILANDIIKGVDKNFSSLPLAGIFPKTHLMTKDDDNALLGGQRFNIYSIFDKPGLAVVGDDGEIKFYSADGLRIGKYGYILVSEAETSQYPHLMTVKESDEVQKAYLKIHQENKPTYQLPQQPSSSPQSLPMQIIETAKADTGTDKAQKLAERLKGIYTNLYLAVKENPNPTKQQVFGWRQALTEIKKQMKAQNCKSEEVTINSDKTTLDRLYKSVDEKLSPYEKPYIDLMLMPKENPNNEVTKVIDRRLAVPLKESKALNRISQVITMGSRRQ